MSSNFFDNIKKEVIKKYNSKLKEEKENIPAYMESIIDYIQETNPIFYNDFILKDKNIQDFLIRFWDSPCYNITYYDINELIKDYTNYLFVPKMDINEINFNNYTNYDAMLVIIYTSSFLVDFNIDDFLENKCNNYLYGNKINSKENDISIEILFLK